MLLPLILSVEATLAGRLRHRTSSTAFKLQERTRRGVGSAKDECGEYDTNEQYEILSDYLIDENGTKSYFSNVALAGNKIPARAIRKITAKPENVILTYGNGWCDKNVYASWNKCAVSGKCYPDCEDGNCYSQVKAQAKEIEVPGGCMEWMMLCAKQCSADSNCKAFAFRNTNILGNAEYTCNLMDSVLCTRDEMTYGDPRSVFHVKGSAIQALYDEYGVSTMKELKKAKYDQENDHKFDVWSSWGYHMCHSAREDGQKCGIGFQKRHKTSEAGKMTTQKRDCEFKNAIGDDLECLVNEDDAEVNQGHGWMEWGEWSQCSQSCGTHGTKKRVRRCGTCSDSDANGLCDNPTDPIHRINTEDHIHCPLSAQSEFGQCNLAKCLPWANGKPGAQKYVIRNGWQTYQAGTPTQTTADYEGGCTNFKVNSIKKRVQINQAPSAFAECLKLCANNTHKCHSVTFFPRLLAPDWVTFWKGDHYNCFLHTRRCHEDAEFRDASYLDSLPVDEEDKQTNAVSWYAYKDLCSNTLICDRWGSASAPWYQANCDSTGDNAFPSQPACNCPFSADHRSGVRAFGNAVGYNYYDPADGRIKSRRHNKNKGILQRSEFYTEKKYYHGIPEPFWENIEKGLLPCHDPCAHSRCDEKSQCVFNPDSPVGYDCMCQWPAKVDTSRFGGDLEYVGLAGFDQNKGCITDDFRDIGVSDNQVLFGGGWNTLKDPGQTRPVKPHTAYYELKSTEDPWVFNVAEVTRIPPTSPMSEKGRFYNCIVNLDHERMMVVGGKSGQFFDAFDDKTMVYQWKGDLANGTWTGLDGEDLAQEECQGEVDSDGITHGCTRTGEWPDYPHSTVFMCQGQCRAGKLGKGPTNVHWLNAYCTVSAKFYNSNSNSWEQQSFELCRHKLARDDQNGEEVVGISDNGEKWVAVENSNFGTQWHRYNQALMASLPFFGSEKLYSLDVESHPAEGVSLDNQGQKVINYWRWKSGKQLPSDMYNPMLGMTFRYQNPVQGRLRFNTGRNYHGMGQPLCGLVGDRVLTGSGMLGRILSLSKTPETVKREQVWRLEEGSEFPILHKKSTGEQCMIRDEFNSDGVPVKLRPLDARRQNFGTTVTTEGLWMIGGLLEPAADLPYRSRSDMFNIPGCTKRAHLNDVWVFNPKGWTRNQILGEAANKYKGQNAAEILPTIAGYPFSQEAVEVPDLPQSFDSFRLYDENQSGVSLSQAIEEGWECTGIDGKWCRKPFLNRPTKGAESNVMCFEYREGFEDRNLSKKGDNRQIPKRPRICSIDETKEENNCICYIIQASGQSGPKQTPDGAGFRPEIDYLEVRRADGTFGSDKPFYADVVDENCPEAVAPYPAQDGPLEHDHESAVSDATQCTPCNDGDDCNRRWRKKNLRRRWHEAGRIRNARMGSLSAVLKGELLLWGGECYGDLTVRDYGADGLLRTGVSTSQRPRPCRMITEKSGERKAGDYVELFSFVRMNRAGYLFGERRQIDLKGFPVGSASHDESAVSQAFSLMNTVHE